MRSKRLGNGYRLYLNEHDFRVLLGIADDLQDELAVRLGGECGLRVSETVEVEPRDVRESTHPEVSSHFLKVRHAKDTTGEREEGKFREAFLPRLTETRIHEYTMQEGLEPTDPVFDVCKRTLQGYLKDIGKKAAEKTGEEMWENFSSHDLRAFFASNLLIRYDVNPEVVKEIGGWEDYKGLKPYLDKPSDDIIEKHLSEVGALSKGYTPVDDSPDPDTDAWGEMPADD